MLPSTLPGGTAGGNNPDEPQSNLSDVMLCFHFRTNLEQVHGVDGNGQSPKSIPHCMKANEPTMKASSKFPSLAYPTFSFTIEPIKTCGGFKDFKDFKDRILTYS